ncbi:uncharacterized protein [Amphiura filiformis]|uniref:uncharacterized protein isoform X2 n=1 Tax=Amphiura filiformis TaxID=82378 RepID=UPI003B218511
MDAQHHTRYSMLQPSVISSSNSEIWSALSQSFLLPSPSSSFNDLRELGVYDNLPSAAAPSSNENNFKSELASDREIKLDSIQRKLSLDFLNSNRRDMHIESELSCQADSQERLVMGKDTTSTLRSLNKPVLHNMATARSISPLPGVHTFRKKPEGIDNSRSPVYGEHQPTGSSYDQSVYQTHMDTHSPSMYYPSHHQPHVYNNGSFSSQVSYKPTYEVPPPVITVSRDTPSANPTSYPDSNSSYSSMPDAFAVHTYTSSPNSSTVDSVTSRYDGRQLVGNTQNYPYHNWDQGVVKTIQHRLSGYDGRSSEIGSGYYSSSPSPPYECTDRHFQESTDYINLPIVVTTSHGQSRINTEQVMTKAVTVPRNVAPSGRATNQCHICRKTYGRPSTLKTHVRTHLGDRPYQCQLCGKSFTQPANLTAHIRIHSGEKPFSCPVCRRQFSQSSSLKTHMRTHSGERPYMCNICKKSFADSSTLTKHRRTHTGEKPYQCSVCLQQFSQSGNLKRHMKVHTDN